MDNIKNSVNNSVQSGLGDDTSTGVQILNFSYKTNELFPAWWSPSRDRALRKFVVQSDHMQGAIYKATTKLLAIKPKVEPRDNSIKKHVELASFYNALLQEGSEFGQGWQTWFMKFLYDMFTQDNGAFSEIIGAGRKDKPIKGRALGLAVLDSQRCRRTSNPEYPVVYEAEDGNLYKLHYTRVLFKSQQPSTQASMNGVGHSWVSRSLNVMQNLVDIAIYKQEKLGSRPLRQMMIGKGIGAQQIWDAIYMANESMDNGNLRRYAKNVVIGSEGNTNIDIDIKDLASTPDGFSEQESTELAMFAIALAGGFPPRDLWPATTVGATKADAMFQQLSGVSGYETILSDIAFMLGGSQISRYQLTKRFIPPELKITFDFVDDDKDDRQAQIKERRSIIRTNDLANGVVDIRTSREQALATGDLTQAQFDALELGDGRLPDGGDTINLFLSEDREMMELLALQYENPLDVDGNIDSADDIITNIKERILNANRIIMNSSSEVKQRTARQALSALNQILELYHGDNNGEVETQDQTAITGENTSNQTQEKTPKAKTEVTRRTGDSPVA